VFFYLNGVETILRRSYMTTIVESPASLTTNETGIRGRVAPIPLAFLDRVRNEGTDDLGQPVKHLVARGGEPCREILRRASPGEALILASFTPFAKSGPYKEYGPIFVLAHESGESVRRDWIDAGSAQNYLREQFVIRAYSEAEEIIDAALVSAADAQHVAERFFAMSEAAFLHVRFPAYGCFACRLDRP